MQSDWQKLSWQTAEPDDVIGGNCHVLYDEIEQLAKQSECQL